MMDLVTGGTDLNQVLSDYDSIFMAFDRQVQFYVLVNMSHKMQSYAGFKASMEALNPA